MADVALSTRRKAAIVFASLDRDKAAGLLRTLPNEALQTLAIEISNIGEINALSRDLVFKELADALQGDTNIAGGEAVARALLQRAVGDAKADELLNQAGKQFQAFSALAEGNSEDLANILSKEQPAIVAMIISFMPPKKGAEILSHLPTDVREEVIARLAQKRNTDRDVVRRIETVVVQKVKAVLDKGSGGEDDGLGGPSFVAEILQHVDRSLEVELMSCVEGTSPEAAEKIRELMFCFEDVGKLSDSDIQKVLRSVPMDKLVIALRGVPEELSEKITGNLSKRARENLAEEMDLMGKVRLRDIEAEQRNVVAIVRSLDMAGEISLRGSDDGGDVYV